MDKKALREMLLKQNMQIDEKEKKLQDMQIEALAEELPELMEAEKVFAYCGVGSEIDTKEIIKNLLDSGKKVYTPLCYGGGEMDAVLIKDMSELSPGRYGIPEPPDKNKKAKADELDVIIVPGVAFDESGMRLGRGGGYYDRFIEKAKTAVLVALCREKNILETVPAEAHDRAVDIIITEKRVIRKGR